MTCTSTHSLTSLQDTFCSFAEVCPETAGERTDLASDRCRFTSNCNQPVFDGARDCYYHAKKRSGLIGESAAYPVLTAKQWKEIREHEVPTDPASLENLVALPTLDELVSLPHDEYVRDEAVTLEEMKRDGAV